MSNIKPIEVKYIILKLRDPFFAKSVLERIRKIPGVVSVEQVLIKLQKDPDVESAYQAATPRLMN